MRIAGESSVVLKIHDNVFLGLHYTIFCIRMDSRRKCIPRMRVLRRTAGNIPDITVQPEVRNDMPARQDCYFEIEAIRRRQNEDNQKKWFRGSV